MPLNFTANVLNQQKTTLIQKIKDSGKYSDVIDIYSPITRELSLGLYEYLHNAKYANKDKALFILTSDGGDPDAAYQIADLARKTFKQVEFAIPRRAKSAATLLALSGDVIHMSNISELGPVDIQIKVDEGLWISGNSIKDSMKKIEEEYKKNPELAKEWLKQINPIIFSELDRKNEIVRQYATKIWGIKDKKKAIEKLTSEYPHHGYAIDVDEIKELGFNVSSLESLPDVHMPIIEVYKIDEALQKLSHISKVYEQYKDEG